jgi:photosystem II stability/assembly factor-like uncharacterized protein
MRGRSLTVIGVLCAVAACSSPDDRSEFTVATGTATTVEATTPIREGTSEPMASADADERYTFRRVALTGGGWMTGLTLHPTDPDARFTRSDVGGAYRWNPDGQEWIQMLDAASVPEDDRDASLYHVESIAVAPSDSAVVYLGAGNDPPSTSGTPSGRILRSDDGGRSWESSAQRFVISGNGDYRQQTTRLAVDPFTPTTLLVGTREGALWRSTDGGRTFEAAEAPPNPDRSWEREAPGVTFVVADPDGPTLPNGGAAEWFAAVGGSAVLHSTDGGSTWESIRSLEPAETLLDGQIVDGVLYAARRGADGGGGLVSFDGSEWTTFGPSSNAQRWTLAVDPTDQSRMVAADDVVSGGSVFVTLDAGRSWSAPDVETYAPDTPWIEVVDDGSYMVVGELAFDRFSDDAVWFASGNGVWEADLDPNRLDWTYRGAGLEALVVADMVAPPGAPALITAVADAQGFRHVDPDVTPTEPLIDTNFAGGTDLDYAGSSPNALAWIGAEYHLAERYRTGRAARSPDDGETWFEMPGVRPDMYGGNVAISADDPDNIVWVPSRDATDDSAGPPIVFVTHDGGTTWETSSVDLDGGLHRLVWWFTRQALTSDKVEPRTFYLMDDRAGLSVSVDGGTTWTRAAHAPPCIEADDCHVFGELRADPRRGRTLWASVGSGGLYRTSDAGSSSWEKVSDIEHVRSYGFGAPVSGADVPALYAYGRIEGVDAVWRSVDDGRSFELVSRFPGSPRRSAPPTSSSGRSSRRARACSPRSWSPSSRSAATRCPPEPFADVRRVVEEDLGRPLEECSPASTHAARRGVDRPGARGHAAHRRGRRGQGAAPTVARLVHRTCGSWPGSPRSWSAHPGRRAGQPAGAGRAVRRDHHRGARLPPRGREHARRRPLASPSSASAAT